MDVEKDKDVCLFSVSESTAVSVREHVAGETQVEVSLSVGVERVEDGGGCNGDDIMVEVLGSDVYVDGVCTHGEGGRSGLAEDAIGGSGDGKSLVRNGGRSALSLRGIGVSGGEASNLQSETGVECSLGMVESPGKQASVVKAEKVEVTMREGGSIGGRPVGGEGQKETVGTGRRNDDLTRQDVTCLDGEAQNTAIGAGDGGSLAFTGSTCVETRDAHVEEVVVVAGEAVLEKKMVEVGAERGREVIGGGSDGIEGTNTKEVVVFDDKDKTTRLENGVGDSSVVVGSVGVETRVVKEDGMTQTVEGLEPGLIVEGAEDGRELAYVGLDAANNFSKQEVGVGDDEVWNPGIDGKAISMELVVEKSSLQAQDFKEKVPVMVTEEMNPKIVTSGSCALEGVVCNSGREQSSITEPTFGGTKKDAASSKSLDEESKAAATGEVEEMDEGDTLCSKVGGVESDAIDGNTTCSMEKQLEKVDKFGESFENHSDVSSNPVSSCPPNQGVVGGDNMVMDDKGPLNSESDQQFNHEEGLDKIIAHDPVLMEVDEQVIDAVSVCLHGGGIEGIEEQSVKVETTCVFTVSQSNVSADLTSNQVVVGGEAAAAKDDKVFSDSNAVVPETIAKARKSDFSENDRRLKAEILCGSTQGDAQVTDEKETVLMDCEAILDSNCEVPGAAEKNKLLESEMCLEKGMAGDLSIDSNIGQETEVKRQVVNAECADATSHQRTQVVAEAEVAAVEGNFLLNPNVETDTQVIVRAEIVPGGIEVLNSNMDIPGSVEFEECIEKSLADDFAHLDAKNGSEVEVVGQETLGEQVDLHGEQEMEVEDNIADTELSKADEEKFVERADLNSGSVVKVHQARYLLPSENEGEFSISDLVWGKVRSHPWWPGQIFDPADSSEKAMKHHKKDCFLVAYFGDRTFAWNEASQLKPFQTHFSHEEKQSNSEAFQNAVECALEEVSRRVELGLACSCIPQDAYDKIQFQIVENTGIREEASTRRGVVRTANSSYFEPDKLMEYMKALARFPSGGSDQLELVIAKAQLLSFYRLKGYCSLPDLQFCGQLLESDTDTVVSEDRMHSSEVFEHATALYKDDELTSSKQEICQSSSFNKRKHNLKDDVLYKKKERSMSELMGDSADGDNWSDGKTAGNSVSLSSGKKRKTVEYHDDHGPQDGRKTISFAKVSNTSPSSFPKPSFKIGDCIRRVASQLTGSHSILKCNSERFQKLDGSNEIPAGDEADFSFLDSVDAETEKMIDTTDYSSLDDLFSQLLVAAQDPLKGNSFSNIIASFFFDFRNSVLVGQPSDREFLALDKVGRRKRSSHSVGGPPETFEFEDMSDTYWTDRVIQNGSEEQPPRKNRKREYQIVPVVLEKPLQVSRRPYSRKRYSDGNQVVADDKPAGYVDENSPAEIVMNFSEVRSVPSETNLNKMFGHFGPLKESETEVDRDTSRARVVFKKSSDAEVAFNSAGRFKIFGPTLVNYQINYTPCALFKASPMDIAQDHEMQLDLAALEVDLV